MLFLFMRELPADIALDVLHADRWTHERENQLPKDATVVRCGIARISSHMSSRTLLRRNLIHPYDPHWPLQTSPGRTASAATVSILSKTWRQCKPNLADGMRNTHL